MFVDSSRRGWRGGATRVWPVIVILLAGLVACSSNPPEARLRERIAAMQAALEEPRPADFMRGIAEDFSGEGGMDRAMVHTFLRAQLLRHAHIGASLGPLDIQLHGERANVRFTAVLSGGEGFLPDRIEGWRIESGWRDGPDGWQLIQATWQPAL